MSGKDVSAPSAESTPFRTLPSRFLTGAVCAWLIGWGIFSAPLWAFSLITFALIVAGLHEFFTMLRLHPVKVYRFFGVCVGAVIPVVVHFQLGYGRSGEVLFIVLACFCIFLIQFSRNDNPHALEAVSMTFFGIMYVSWFLSFVIKIRHLPGGAYWVAYLVAVTKSGDIGAYLGGSFFGRHSLLPHISPKKSVEGTLAGVTASAIVSLLFYDILPFKFGALQLALLGLFIGLIGECGDLSESLIKRYCGVKDSGRLLPGFGGVLDLLDSVLFTAPLFYFYLQTVGPFTP